MNEDGSPNTNDDCSDDRWYPDVLESDQLVEDIIIGGPPKTLDDLPLYIRDDIARLDVPPPFNPHAEGIDARLKAAVCSVHWRVPADRCGLLRIRSLRCQQTTLYVVAPDLWQSLVAHAARPDDRSLFADLLWRGGQELFSRLLARAPYAARKAPMQTPEYDLSVPMEDVTAVTGLYDMWLHRVDGDAPLLASRLGPATADDEIFTTMGTCLDGCVGTPKVAPAFGGMLYKRQDVERAMGRSMSGNPETRERQKAFFKGLLDEGGSRRLQSAPDPDSLSVLRKDFPNFACVVDFIAGQCGVARQNGSALAWPPILLLGPPGVGKTEFSLALASSCGLSDEDREVLCLGTASAGFTVTGSSSSWGGGKAGALLNRLLASQILNPVLILDEVDKAGGSSQFPVDQVLLGLLEPTTAKSFTDEWAGIPVDASRVLWIATANDFDRISGPVRSRFIAFKINPLSALQTQHVALRMHETMAPRGLEAPLAVDVLDRLGRLTPRRIRLSLLSAYGRCVLRGGEEIVPADLDAPDGFVPDDDDVPARRLGFL